MNAPPAQGGIDVLVVGAGMYVSGRGSDGPGTVLPSVVQAAREGLVGSITVASTRPDTAKAAADEAVKLCKAVGVTIPVLALPADAAEADAYQRALADRKPTCAIVAVPDHLHYEVAGWLIDHGVHVQVVKPLTPTLAEALDLVARCDRVGVIGRVEFHKRYDESNLVLKDLLASGELGDPVEFAVRYSQRKSIPTKTFAAWVDRTDIFQYLGVHYVDLIHFITGAVPERLSAVGTRGWLEASGIRNFDAIHATIEWRTLDAGRFVSTHFTSWIDPETSTAMSDQRLHFVGTKGRIECDQKDRGIRLVTDQAPSQHINPYFSRYFRWPGERHPSFAGYGHRSIHHFLMDVRAVQRGEARASTLEQGRPTFRSALASVAAVEAARVSVGADGAWVEVEDVTPHLTTE